MVKKNGLVFRDAAYSYENSVRLGMRKRSLWRARNYMVERVSRKSVRTITVKLFGSEAGIIGHNKLEWRVLK